MSINPDTKPGCAVCKGWSENAEGTRMNDEEIDRMLRKAADRALTETPEEATARYIRLLERFADQIPEDERELIRAMLESDTQSMN